MRKFPHASDESKERTENGALACPHSLFLPCPDLPIFWQRIRNCVLAPFQSLSIHPPALPFQLYPLLAPLSRQALP